MDEFVEPRRALLTLLNIAVGPEQETDDRAESFVVTYGSLRGDQPILGVVLEDGSGIRPETKEEARTRLIDGISELARIFSQGIERETKSYTALNRVLSQIFQKQVRIGETLRESALEVDFLAGTIEPRPRDLLDAVALELMHSRKAIARCALCSKFFYRQWNKDRYCSAACGNEARRRQQADWIARDRAKKKVKQPQTKKGSRTR